MKAKTCFSERNLPDGGTNIKYADIQWEEQEHLVCRPRWFLMFVLLYSLIFYSLFVWVAKKQEIVAAQIGCYVMAALFGWIGLWVLSQLLAPQKWRFLFAIGQKGLVLRIGWLCRSYWHYPWAELENIDINSQHVPGQLGGMDFLRVNFRMGTVRYKMASFMRLRKKITPLVEKYKSQSGNQHISSFP